MSYAAATAAVIIIIIVVAVFLVPLSFRIQFLFYYYFFFFSFSFIHLFFTRISTRKRQQRRQRRMEPNSVRKKKFVSTCNIQKYVCLADWELFLLLNSVMENIGKSEGTSSMCIIFFFFFIIQSNKDVHIIYILLYASRADRCRCKHTANVHMSKHKIPDKI